MEASPPTSREEEWELVQAVLRGETEATNRFSNVYRDALTGYLCSKCDPGDGRSREKASEIVDEMIAVCCHGDPGKNKPPLLRKYGGKGSLEGWLRRSVRCRLISWWRSLEYRSERTESSLVHDDDDHSPLETRLATTAEDVFAEPAIAEVLRDALAYAFDRAAAEEPLGLVFLRLASIYGVQKQRLAEAWQRDPAQAGRRIAKALDIIRNSAQEYVRSIDPWLRLEWTDYLRVFEKYPRLLHGDEEEDKNESENASRSPAGV